MKITADTITDEQILELRSTRAAAGDDRTVETCNIALYDERTLSRMHTGDVLAMKRDARARCAEILNARGVK